MRQRPPCVFLDRASIDLDDLDLSQIEQSTELVSHAGCSADEVLDKCRDAEIIIVNKVRLQREHFTALPRLRLVCVIATGTNNVDLGAASESGVVVCNVRDYAAASVSQHVMMLILALTGHFLQYQRDIHQGAWQNQDQFCLLTYPMQELQGKTIGLIGYGHIAHAVEKLALAFGMQVLIGQSLNPASANQPDRVELDELYRQSDIISVHCPLTEQSRNLITRREFDLMKPSAMVINAARGGIINETDLIAALQGGQIAGAGIDCLTEEPPSADHPLITAELPQLIITPHNAWGTIQARQRLVDGTARNIQDYLDQAIHNQVNP